MEIDMSGDIHKLFRCFFCQTYLEVSEVNA